MPRELMTGTLLLRCAAGDLAIEARAAEDQGAKLRTFQMTAYTGVPMVVAGWEHPVVVDLAGLDISDRSRPILKDHNGALIVGHTDAIRTEDGSLRVAGTVSGAGRVAAEVVQAADNGFPWRASIGIAVLRAVYLAEGRSATVNGREVTGPLYIAQRSRLGEISFVALGADDATDASITAGASPSTHLRMEIITMEFNDWLKAQGFTDPTTLTEEQTARLQAVYDQLQAKQASTTVVQDPPDNGEDGKDTGRVDLQAQLQAVRDAQAADVERIAKVREICAKHPKLEAQAIREGWDETRAELAVLRATRPQAPSVVVPDRTVTGAVLEAACLMTGRCEDLTDHCDEQALDVAAKRYRGGIGLQELLLEAAWANGYTGRTFRDNRAVLRAAFGHDLQAGFSVISLPGILSNIANKFLLEGFYSVEDVWRRICAVRSVSDFKTITSYRLIGAGEYELVPPGGEIKHGKLSEQGYSNKADTYALMLAITRPDIINDDLGAITAVPRMLGRGSGLKINDIFWATFLDNATFFAAANKNLLTGADTALTIDGLTKAETAFLDQTGPDNKPLGVMPSMILAPTGLGVKAESIYKSAELRDTALDKRFPVANPHQGKYRAEVSAYLKNPTYTGASDKAWYLLADPRDLAVIEVAFLNGQESPTIETADADFNTLGIQMRGFHDFGVRLQEPRGGVKSAGE